MINEFPNYGLTSAFIKSKDPKNFDCSPSTLPFHINVIRERSGYVTAVRQNLSKYARQVA
jgi:hypothetical protein